MVFHNAKIMSTKVCTVDLIYCTIVQIKALALAFALALLGP